MRVLKLSSYILTASILALAPVDSAKAQRFGYAGSAYPAPNVETVNINAYLGERDKLDLTRVLKLNQAVRQGKTLSSITVTASSTAYNSKLVLKHNGARVDAVNLDYFQAPKTLQVPTVLQPQDRLVLVSKGQAHVATIHATMTTGYSPYPGAGTGMPQVLKARINEQVRGHSILKILQLVKNQNNVILRGQKIKKVVMRAHSNGRMGASAQLLLNGMPMGVPQTITSGTIIFNLSYYGPQTLGREIKSLRIKVTGRAMVKMVGVKLDDHAPPRNQVVSSYVNRTFYGNERISLSDLFGHAKIPRGAQVESITIIAEGQGKIMMTGTGMVLGSLAFTYYSSKVQTVKVPGPASVEGIKMRIRGSVIIKEVQVRLRNY